VDSVSEVMTIKSSDIEPTPHFGARIDTRHVLAMAKSEKSVKQLIDIDHVLHEDKCLAHSLPPAPATVAA
jgi:purine-binding chemotaxis protein CheW